MIKKNISVKLLAVLAGVFLLLTPNIWAQDAPVEKTGQTNCWDTVGNPIGCAGTGQDGNYQAGVAWPVPRFTDNGDGTVIDNLTGLMWAQDADLIGDQYYQRWNDAIHACENLELGQNGCKLYSDWRLPNVKELMSLVDFSNYNPALPSGHPFINVQSNYLYWSSTTSFEDPLPPEHHRTAWRVKIGYGYLSEHPKYDYNNYVWPVRGPVLSDPPASVEKTGNTICYKPGEDGCYQKGVAWPTSRFTDNGDGTVTDNLTGLMWAQDADLIGYQYWNDAIMACENLELGQNGCKLYSDWRLPNIKELQSLIDFGNINPALPSGHPFANVKPLLPYWSSTTYEYTPNSAWALNINSCYLDNVQKDLYRYVWPVRGGNCN